MRPSMPWRRRLPIRASRWRKTHRKKKWRRTIPAFAKKSVSAFAFGRIVTRALAPDGWHLCAPDTSTLIHTTLGFDRTEIGDADQEARQEPYGGAQRRFRMAHLAGRYTQDVGMAANHGDRCHRYRARNLLARPSRSLERITGSSDKSQRVLACRRCPAFAPGGLKRTHAAFAQFRKRLRRPTKVCSDHEVCATALLSGVSCSAGDDRATPQSRVSAN